MIGRIPPLKDLAEAVAQHHEWFDGTGYPNQIAGESQSLAARILAVADCFDAMTTTRAYRPALTHEQAVAELIGGAGTQFDPEVVRIFIDARVGNTRGLDAVDESSRSAPNRADRNWWLRDDSHRPDADTAWVPAPAGFVTRLARSGCCWRSCLLDLFDISLPRGDSVGVAGALAGAAVVVVGPVRAGAHRGRLRSASPT